MLDVLAILIIVAFFAASAAFVRGSEKIIRSLEGAEEIRHETRDAAVTNDDRPPNEDYGPRP